MTEPPEGSSDLPQVLARSNIRSRTNLPNHDEHHDQSTATGETLEFHTRDARVLEGFISQDPVIEELQCDTVDDTIDRDPFVTQAMDPFPDGSISDDPYLNGYIEVYGPERRIPTLQILRDGTTTNDMPKHPL